MNTHSIALMMLGMAIGGSVATTVLCLCAAARCQDCRFRFGPEWPTDDLPAGGQFPSTAPANSPARIGSHASAECATSREQVDGAQVGVVRESRAGLGGLPACWICGKDPVEGESGLAHWVTCENSGCPAITRGYLYAEDARRAWRGLCDERRPS